MFRWRVTVADIYKVEFTTSTEEQIHELAREAEEEHHSRLGFFLHEKQHVLHIKRLPEQENPMALRPREIIDPLRAIDGPDDQATRTTKTLAVPNSDRVDLRTDLAVLTPTVAHPPHRLTTLAWSIGVGFALVMAVLLLR